MEILRNIFENLKNEIGKILNEARNFNPFYPWYQNHPYEYALNHSATGST